MMPIKLRDEKLMLRNRLERVALCADIASHYIQDMRVVPASGVARVIWDAIDFLDALENQVREEERDRAAEWRDSDKQRADDAEAKLANAIEALEKCYEDLHEVESGDLSTFDAQDSIADAINALIGDKDE